MEKFSYSIVSSRLFIHKIILGNFYGILAFLFGILGFSTGSSESILVSLGAPFWMNLICAVAFFGFMALCIKYFNIKPKLGELNFNKEYVAVKLNKSKDKIIPYNDITGIKLYLNNKRDKVKYSRGFFDGYNNWIIFNKNVYVFEFFMSSYKKENDLVAFLKMRFGEKFIVNHQSKHILLSSNWYK